MRIFSKYIVILASFLCFLLFITPLCLGDQLIAPTRTLQGPGEAQGKLTVVSEPSDLDVFLDGSRIGKTPLWLKEVKPGSYKLQVKHSETEIYVNQGKTLQVNLFKGSFIIKEKTEVKKQLGPEKEVLKQVKTVGEPAKEDRKKDLTPWELFINRSSPHF